jgi:hypothetical protein
MKLIKIAIVVVMAFTLLSSISYAGKGADFYLDKGPISQEKVITSRIISFDNPMDRAVLSWNASTPNKSFIKTMLRAKMPDGRWTNWFKMGVWGEEIKSHSIKGQKNRYGSVDIDTLELKEPALEWQYKVTLHKGKNKTYPTLNAVALTVKNSKEYKKNLTANKVSVAPVSVPAFSQFEEGRLKNNPDLGKRICSATSVTMLLKHNHLENISPSDIAAKVYDNKADAYGNWSFNTATLFSTLKPIAHDNFATYVRWFESFDELLRNIKKDGPAIVSIGFKKGELQGAPVATPGHLVLVRGADSKYVYVNDPAAQDNKTVPRKYLRTEFTKAWKGMAYILDKSI